MGEIGCVFGVPVCGNMEPAKFCTYPCRGVLHTPRNNPRRRFAPKIGQVLGVSLLGNMKPAKFFTYPCRGVLHTPRNNPRRRFGCKTGQVLGAVLIGMGEIGWVLGVSLLERVKSGAFLAYPCAEI